MAKRHCLEPLTPASMEVAILGSMPGAASLAAGEYYAHPRNAFWPLMEEVFGVACALSYAERCARLRACRVGLWDVLASCERPGSLDSAIDKASVQANDLARWFAGHPLAIVGLNGSAAAAMFRRHCRGPLETAGIMAGLRVIQLPSSSPSNATQSFVRKAAAWRGLRPRRPLRTGRW